MYFKQHFPLLVSLPVLLIALFSAGNVTALDTSELIKLFPQTLESEDRFGVSVSIDGNTAVIGAPYGDGTGSSSGAVYIYERTNGVWMEQDRLSPDELSGFANFGFSVSLDGGTLLVGAIRDIPANSTLVTGAVYAFGRVDDNWHQLDKFTPSDSLGGDQFGSSISVKGDTALIGASTDDDNAEDSGSAYVFVRSGDEWYQQGKLLPDDVGYWSRFGHSVSLDADTALIGTNSSSAYAFVRSGDEWNQQYKITTTDFEERKFGISVSLEGDTALIGDSENVEQGLWSGAVFMFVRSGDEWHEQAKIVPDSFLTAGDYFGYSISLKGDTLLVGAPGTGDFDGSAYVFEYANGEWLQRAKLEPFDVEAHDKFGHSVSLDVDSGIIGAPEDDSVAEDSGAAYVFDIIRTPKFRCDGFAPPLAESPVRFKRNKAIALRAKLFDDVEGVEITGDDLSFTNPPAVQVWRSPLDPYDPTDPVDVSADALPVGTADLGNQFYYVNTDTGYWQFILDGRSWSAPGRYEVLMDSGEYSDYLIDPTCITEFVVE